MITDEVMTIGGDGLSGGTCTSTYAHVHVHINVHVCACSHGCVFTLLECNDIMGDWL